MTTRAQFQAELAELIADLQPTIGDEYRAYQDSDSDEPSMLLTIGADDTGWSWQTGDTSFTGGAYGYADWGSVAIGRGDDATTLAAELLADLECACDADVTFFYDDKQE
jgi:hypothetical protein